MTSAVRLLRDATEHVIQVNPITLHLYRGVKVSDGAGGFIYTDPIEQLGTVTIRVSELSLSENKKIVEGGEVYAHFVAVTAHHDDDIIDGDYFKIGDRQFQIQFMRPAKIDGFPYKQYGRAEEVNGGIA
jgi:hypothetical protein